MSGFNGQRVSASSEQHHHQHPDHFPADASTNGGDRDDDDLGSGSEHGGEQSYGQQGLGDSDVPGAYPFAKISSKFALVLLFFREFSWLNVCSICSPSPSHPTAFDHAQRTSTIR